MIVYDTTRLRAWLETRLDLKLHPETVFMGAEACGKLATVAAFSHYVPDIDIEISIAHDSKGIASRELVREIFRYVFDQSNCLRCTARIAEDNQQSIKLAERLGFKAEGRLRRGFGNRDALLFGLLRDDTPWQAPAALPKPPIPPPS